MPTYLYQCTVCQERLEAVQKFTDDPLTQCPACHGELRKIFSPVSVIFKGPGFYRTDSRAAANGSNGKAKESADKPAAEVTDKKKKEPAAADSSATSATPSAAAVSTSAA